jgi:hypothetical protein
MSIADACMSFYSSMRSSAAISCLARPLLSFVGLPAGPLPIAVGKALTCGGLRPSPLPAPGTGTGTDPDPMLKLEGAPEALGGELTVEACGIVSGLGMAVPTDCCGAFPAFDRA